MFSTASSVSNDLHLFDLSKQLGLSQLLPNQQPQQLSGSPTSLMLPINPTLHSPSVTNYSSAGAASSALQGVGMGAPVSVTNTQPMKEWTVEQLGR